MAKSMDEYYSYKKVKVVSQKQLTKMEIVKEHLTSDLKIQAYKLYALFVMNVIIIIITLIRTVK